jgi:DNA recombination protein RmuC
MIQIGDIILDFSDPLVIAGAVAAFVLLLLIFLSISALRAANRSARAMEPLAHHIGALGQTVQGLGQGQERLAGGLSHVSDMQARAQASMLEAMERRLEDVQKGMSETLHGTSTRTARSLGELQQKLEQIDRAQAKIEKLSGDVLSLQDILSNKQTRGAFGEIQLNDIVSKALPADAYSFQTTLSNGKRADCLIRLPNPPGPIVIDAKFPLEAYEALVAADGPEAQARALARSGRGREGSYQGHLRALHHRRRDSRRRADVPAVRSRLRGAARQAARGGARRLRRQGLDRVADHLHGHAQHDARGDERRSHARTGRRDPQGAEASAPGRGDRRRACRKARDASSAGGG